MIWLGIESSCDETACAVLQDDPLKVLSNPLYSQIDEHALYGGVVPEIAARAHLQKIAPIAEAAVKEAGVELKDIDAIAYTTGPGLMGPLLVGASFAKGLARDLNIPAYGMNHLEGHLAAAWLSNPDIEPPFLTLTVSGGHTELVMEEPGFKYTSIGRTRDDAAGEAFDKCGKLIGLKYPAGATISRLGKDHNRKFVEFPRALHTHDSCEFSFSGLKTAVLRYTETHDPEFIQQNLGDICASLEDAIVDSLVTKTINALKKTKMKTLVMGGGVSANSWLRTRLQDYCDKKGIRFCVPDRSLSTDNGAMIAAAAIRRKLQGKLESIDVVKPWMPLAL
ncbi:metalloendopeptidase, glycoprotease family [Fibrobacter succinogenes subsp. succinogenes S85]|uniref:tRNA N6-adenosine threonylcarbamoyltransferase n=1 Tax=Fibrobacter succinogenes (strain ATCC 19169 / S85) TaxID=59374 RepID=C9RIN4_FIBSS|nr:tRNA (adenosine(37)-N6)-threonylcarbamoyltransferase complex transferase subunit TsaD [Fibrobacter succinogenes]ACX75505.1 metalloendopeptidase, glycoprotease family [Fibrobacter succinogenes subsp. succinogenes S85]ADL26848.1 metalloendopeptidase, glycoprotease family [Fibrobacter succinogenes subsp. succinogenes S85]